MQAEPLAPLPEPPPGYRSGYVAVIGRPNVGKSTLINALVNQTIAIVSPRPQTTRNRLLGILTRNDAQVIFMDTPGIHAPQHRLGEIMVETAASTIPDADVVLWLVDLAEPPAAEDRQVAEILAPLNPAVPLLLAMNKADLVAPPRREEKAMAYAALAPRATSHVISAARGDGLPALLEGIIAALPEGPQYYPEEQVTDQQERFIAAELVREQVLVHLRQEVPYAIAVVVDQFKERHEGLVYISAIIYVERASQKAIVLGKDGGMLKQIGQVARQAIEQMLDTRVYLDLWVKVRPKWRNVEAELRRLGYTPPPRD